MIPEVAAAARALDEKRGLAGPPTETRKAMARDLLDLGEGRIKRWTRMASPSSSSSSARPGYRPSIRCKATSCRSWSTTASRKRAAQSPTRFAGLAAVAPQAPENAGRELERAVKKLGLKGAHRQFAFARRISRRQEVLADLRERCQALDVPLYIHPRDPSPQMIKPFDVFGFKVGWVMGG